MLGRKGVRSQVSDLIFCQIQIIIVYIEIVNVIMLSVSPGNILLLPPPAPHLSSHLRPVLKIL